MCSILAASPERAWCAPPASDEDVPSEWDLLDQEVDAAWEGVTAGLIRDEAMDAATRVGIEGGPADLAALSALVSVDPATLDADAAVAWLAAIGRVRAWLEARVDEGLLAVAGPATRLVAEPRGRCAEGRSPAFLVDPDREEVALALRCTASYADARITTARRLAALLPATRAALHAGAIDHARAAVMAEAAGDLLRSLPDPADPTGPHPDPGMTPVAVEVCARLEARVLARAPGQTLAGLRRSCARAVHRIQPAGALARARAARRRRDVWITPEADGTAILSTRLDLATAIACERRIHGAADQLRAQAAADGHPVHDGGTTDGGQAARAGEWRAEAVAALLLHGRVDGLPDPQVHVELVIDLPTLLDLADHPAELPGHGPIPARVARELIASAGHVWVRRLVTDPLTGHLLDYGRTRYRLPEALTRYVTTRDRHCRFPCCDHRAEGRDVDLDHAVPWSTGGPTSAANTGPLHRRHHRLKTHHGWSITPLHADGSVTVTSPHGLTHHRPPTSQLEGSLPDPDPPPF